MLGTDVFKKSIDFQIYVLPITLMSLNLQNRFVRPTHTSIQRDIPPQSFRQIGNKSSLNNPYQTHTLVYVVIVISTIWRTRF
jgi:hypothetical protein